MARIRCGLDFRAGHPRFRHSSVLRRCRFELQEVECRLGVYLPIAGRQDKNNNIGDPFQPGSGTANGNYSTDIQLLALSLAYKF
jgi:hypothetical protein